MASFSHGFNFQAAVYNQARAGHYSALDETSPPVFSPADMTVVARSPINGKHLTLGSLAMLSYSSHRDKFPVVSLGRKRVRGYTFGHSMIAGSLAFQTFDTDAFEELIRAYAEQIGWREGPQYVMADELPPFDILVTSVNELGQSSVFQIFGITILDYGSQYNIDQPEVMETYSFMARGMSAPRGFHLIYGKQLQEYAAAKSLLGGESTLPSWITNVPGMIPDTYEFNPYDLFNLTSSRSQHERSAP